METFTSRFDAAQLAVEMGQLLLDVVIINEARNSSFFSD